MSALSSHHWCSQRKLSPPCIINKESVKVEAQKGRGLSISRQYLTDLLRRNAETRGDKPAIIFGGQTITWLELWQKVENASDVLVSQLSDDRQEIVALLEPNSIDFIISFLAIVHAGHIALPLDISFKKLEIDSVLNAVQPAIVLSRQSLRYLVSGNVLSIEELLATKSGRHQSGPQLPPDEKVAILFMSSGTTGQPKIIPNTHANILWDIQAIARPMGWTAKDTLLITLHLSHRHGLVICLIGAIYHGNRVYLDERFDPQRTMKLLQSGDISLYSAVPPIYDSLVNFKPKTHYDLSKVRLFASSSSALPPRLGRAFKARFGKGILDRYGTSETGSIAVKQSSSSGFNEIIKGVKLRLEGNGEVAMQSPGLFPGYFRNSAATRQNLTPDGWWLIGDIGEMHDGRLVLKGRSKETIRKSGYSIYPQDIEWALSQNQGIDEVKVIGLLDKKRLDDWVIAFYTGDASENNLRSYSKTNLPRSWRPDYYIQLDSIPKTRNGKPSIVLLKKMLNEKIADLTEKSKVKK